MLTPLRLTPLQVDRSRYLPPLLLELVEAAERGGDLVPALVGVVRKLGFDGFLYATASYHLRPNNDERIYYFTTLPREWVVRYDQQAYVECDPRVLCSFESALPFVWDQASERGRNPKTDAFLLDAAAHEEAGGERGEDGGREGSHADELLKRGAEGKRGSSLLAATPSASSCSRCRRAAGRA